MTFIDALIKNARADTELLRKLDAQGDNFSIPRTVDFLLRAPTAEKAAIVAGFINDSQFGLATPQESGGEHSVLVVIAMPIQQHAILAVSGFMACVCKLFELDYDGWGCVVQAHT